jgi:quinol monooxygenase YgiN
VLVVTRYRVPEADAETFSADAESAMTVLAAQEGLIGAWLGRNTDDPELWTLTLLWRNVRAYRRALSAYDVKVTAVPLLSRAVDEPSAYVVVGRWTGDPAAGGSLARP